LGSKCLNLEVDLAPERALMKYVIAVKREARDTLGDSLSEIVKGVSGVDPVGKSPNPVRMQVEATPEGIAKLQDLIGDKILIEPLILHEAFSATKGA
jgi:hypothetical protein